MPFNDQFWNPKELSLDQIEEIQKAFADAAIRADKAGFDVIDIHAAYGYLLNQFLSPLSNKRTDQYGGSFANRIRMLVETVRQVRQVWPTEKPLFAVISRMPLFPEI
ncbi:NADH-dependent flavin oxidoreductase [Coemansia interrupta]|uniref:NADH-dependent flavin oxidoreductase n=1 Tax=Coemansia interrupta TaxID=1126814 RepID=A0A9W8H756_9FUNG|nr:NADH-dependent flavin oxidoreductase [Coemansia interrupta]